jgi:hypothetical protein
MRYKSILIVLVSAIFLTGCGSSSGKTKTVKLPSNNPGFFYLETENCYVDLEAEAVFFRLLSCKPLSKDDVSAKLDLPDFYYDLSFNENASISLSAMDASKGHSTFTLDIYKCYQGVDWKEYRRLYALSEENRKDGNLTASTEYWTQMESLVKPFDLAFDSIDIDKLPVIYQYGLYLQLNFENRTAVNFKATELTLTVNGKTRKYALEDLVYSAKPGRTVPGIHPDNLLSSTTSAIFQYLTSPSALGSIDFAPLSLEIGGDLILKRIEFLNHPSVKCAGVSVTSSGDDGVPVERIWDGNSPFKLNTGENINLNISLQNPLFAGKLSGIFADTMLIIYEDRGAEYSEQITIYYNVATNKYFIYAREQDDIDVQSYFDNYYFLSGAN